MKFIRLIEITDKQQLELIKIEFRYHYIRHRILFENTFETAQMAALGNSGALLEVIDEDIVKAWKILEEFGYQPPDSHDNSNVKLLEFIDNLTGKIPWLNQLGLHARFPILILVIIAILTFTILYFL